MCRSDGSEKATGSFGVTWPGYVDPSVLKVRAAGARGTKCVLQRVWWRAIACQHTLRRVTLTILLILKNQEVGYFLEMLLGYPICVDSVPATWSLPTLPCSGGSTLRERGVACLFQLMWVCSFLVGRDT